MRAHQKEPKGPGFGAWGLRFRYEHLVSSLKSLSKPQAPNPGPFARPLTTLSDTKFIYEGWNLIAELAGTSLARTHLWGLDWSGSLQGAGGVGGLLGSYHTSAGTWSLPAYDGNGNLMALLKRITGEFLAAYEYDAFGQTIAAYGSGAETNPFRFSTKFTDTESGLVYYGLRYYTPALGRFINRDPIAENGGRNLYAFVGNGAVNRWDYLGMRFIKIPKSNSTSTEQSGYGAGTVYGEQKTDYEDEIWVLDSFEVRPTGPDFDPHMAVNNFVLQNIFEAPGSQGTSSVSSDGGGASAPDKEHPDCAGLRQSLGQATQIRDKNAGYFAPGGQYAGYTRNISNVDVASMGANLSGAGLGIYSEVFLAPNVPYGGVPGPLGTTSYHLDTRLSGYRTLGAVTAVAGAGLDGYSLGRSAMEGDLAGVSLSVGNLGTGFTAAAWGGVPGLALGLGQIAVNGGLLAYQQYHEVQYREGRDANAAAAFNVANNAQDKIDQVSKQMKELGCK